MLIYLFFCILPNIVSSTHTDPPEDENGFYNITAASENVTDEASDFEKAIRSSSFVDKSLFIKELLAEPSKHILITCPRQFGKSTNLDMARKFFEMSFNSTNGQVIDRKITSNYHLFTNETFNLKITSDKAFFEEHFGQYPVIYLSMANPFGENCERLLDSMRMQIILLFESYEWLYVVMKTKYNATGTSEEKFNDLKLFQSVIDGNLTIDVLNALDILQGYIYDYFGKELMVFIDEYDTPTKLAINWNTNITSIVNFVDSLLYTFTKTSSHVKRLIISGISYIYRAADSSKVRDIHHYRFLDDHRFAKYYGFTQNEVNQLFVKNEIDKKNHRDEMRDLCNGYKMRHKNISLYSPLDWREYFKESNYTVFNHWVKRGSWNPLSALLHYDIVSRTTLSLLSVKRVNFQLLTDTKIENLQEFAKSIDPNIRKKIHLSQSMVNLYLTDVFERGYLCYANGEDDYKIPNKGVENVIKDDFQHFFDNTYDVDISNSTVPDKFRSIVETENTTSSMVHYLIKSLNDSFKGKELTIRNDFQFRAIIFALIYYGSSASREIQVKNIDDDSEIMAIRPGRSDIILLSDDQDIMLIAEVKFQGNVTQALEEAMQYVPIEPRKKSKLKIIKYLGINMNEKRRVRVKAGANRYDW